MALKVEPGAEDEFVVKGSLTLEEAAEFRELVKSQINQGKTILRLDFSAVNYVDSAGIGAIVAAERSYRKVEGKLVLFNVGREVMRVFKSMKLDSILNIENSAG